MQPNRLTRLPDGRLQINAHCKLNLGLRVFPARPDGFHDLETWMVPTSWYDTLWVDANQRPDGGAGHRQDADGTLDAAGELRLVVTGRAEGVPTELEKNLVGRAALKLAAAAGIEPRGVITLHKVLPPGGGIGGGSSDAAAALVALNEAWGLHWEAARLEAVAAQLGSDIPFFIQCRPSLCTGRGEIMTALYPRHTLYAVLIIPPLGCPTREVYQAFDSGHQHQQEKTDWARCAGATADELSVLLVNDLEPAAFAVAPWLADLRAQAAAVLGRAVHMTGSGSTLFTLCDTGAQADEIHARLAAKLSCASVPVRILA